MTHFLSVWWTGKRAVFLGLTFSLYTLTLMFVFHAVEHAHYNMSPTDTPTFHSSWSLIYSDSNRPMSRSHVIKTGQVSAADSSYNDDVQEIPPVLQNDEPHEIPHIEMNVKPPKIPLRELNVKPLKVQSMKQNYLPPKMLPIDLGKQQQPFMSVKLNVRHIPRNDSVLSKRTKDSRDSSTYFRPRLYGPALELLLDTIAMFDLVMMRHGLDYMLYGGSLIGSYRHHGLVPWDDDVDVLVPHSKKSALFEALSSLSPQYILNKDWNFSWKLFSVKADEIRSYNWKWPYLDIFFYAENETHIWDVAPQYMQNYVFLQKIVFPLKRRPFMGLRLLTPSKPRAVIDTNYDVSLCQSGKWIHKWERYGVDTTVHCSVLYSKFPFVFRTFQNGGCNESLLHNSTLIGYYFETDSPCDR